MAETVKVARCTARAAGTGALCTLAEGHAAEHKAAGQEWPSETSAKLAELHRTQRKLRDMALELVVDATVPGAAHDPVELLRWFERDFPAAFPAAQWQIDKQARLVARGGGK